MNKNILKGFLLLSLMMGILSCGSDDTPTFKTPEEIAVEQLAGDGSITWRVGENGTVTKDGNNQSETFRDFTIQFNASNQSRTYITANHNGLFDLNGNWSLTGNNLDRVILTGEQPAAGQEIQYTRNGDQLRLTFTVPMPSARVTAVAGSYVFELRKAQ